MGKPACTKDTKHNRDDERDDERDDDQSNNNDETHPGHESGEGVRAAQSVVGAGGGGTRTPRCGRVGGRWK